MERVDHLLLHLQVRHDRQLVRPSPMVRMLPSHMLGLHSWAGVNEPCALCGEMRCGCVI